MDKYSRDFKASRGIHLEDDMTLQDVAWLRLELDAREIQIKCKHEDIETISEKTFGLTRTIVTCNLCDKLLEDFHKFNKERDYDRTYGTTITRRVIR